MALIAVKSATLTCIQLLSSSAAQFYDIMTSMTRMTKINRNSHDWGTWAVAEAKARFSELIDRALADGPQTITRKGKMRWLWCQTRSGSAKQSARATLQSSSQPRPCAARISRLGAPKMDRARSSHELSLDTDVVSEWVRPQPGRNVISWLAEVDEDRVYISEISLAEIRRRVEILPAGVPLRPCTEMFSPGISPKTLPPCSQYLRFPQRRDRLELLGQAVGGLSGVVAGLQSKPQVSSVATQLASRVSRSGA